MVLLKKKNLILSKKGKTPSWRLFLFHNKYNKTNKIKVVSIKYLLNAECTVCIYSKFLSSLRNPKQIFNAIGIKKNKEISCSVKRYLYYLCLIPLSQNLGRQTTISELLAWVQNTENSRSEIPYSYGSKGIEVHSPYFSPFLELKLRNKMAAPVEIRFL